MNLPSSCVLVLGMSLLMASCGSDEPVPATDAGIADVGVPDLGTDAAIAAVDAGDTDAGAAGDTWTSFGQSFFATYCVACHFASPKDFNLIADVRAMAPRIRCGVSDVPIAMCDATFPSPRQFPIGTGPRPTDAERARLVAWLDAGAPE